MFKNLIILIITIIIAVEINTQIIERIYDQYNDKTVSVSFLSTHKIKSVERNDVGECLSICSTTSGCESIVISTGGDGDKTKKSCHLLKELINPLTDLVDEANLTVYNKYGKL
jgi:phosphosulfolactate synthase (CoM biosynthesis protein A)